MRSSALRVPVRELVVLAAAAALLCAAWLQLESGSSTASALARTVALALAPALVLLATGRVLVSIAIALVALLPAAGYAFGVPVTHMRTGKVDFWGPLFARISDGFSDFYSTRVPFDRIDHPYMEGVVLMAIFLFVVVTGLLFAARRTLLAGIAFVLGVGWPATIAATIPGATPLRTGAVILGAVLLFLYLTRDRPAPARAMGPVIVLGVALVGVAVAASTSGAVAKAGVLHWQRWNYSPPVKQIGVRYVWSSNYSGISFPKKSTVVLRIKGTSESLYWRATTLDEYTGIGWREKLVTGPLLHTATVDTASNDPLLPAAARDPKNWTRQDVTVEALADTHFVGANAPVKWEPAEGQATERAQNGTLLAPDGLKPKQHYSVWSYTPNVTPGVLAKAPARYSTSLTPFLEFVPGVTVPEFGAPGRDAQMRAILHSDPLLASYEALYDRARQVVGKAKSPYVAAATLEVWFRNQGGFHYTEHPEQPLNGAPPLLDFVLRTKQGYCQHFAGAMALMLRLLGVPSRVAAGFTSGTYDKNRGEWVVTDHNAHTWVEVYFPGYGWLPFDPTPGRGVLGVGSSTTSPEYARVTKSLLKTLSGLGAPTALRARLQGGLLGGTGDLPTGGTLFPGGFQQQPKSGGPSIAAIVFAVLASLLVLLLGTKAMRRALRFRSRDPREMGTACRRDLIAYLADQGVRVSPSVTLEEVGKLVERRYAVSARSFVAAALQARFGPPGHADDAARRARRELRHLERGIRFQLRVSSRVRGALSLRSLAV